MRIKMGFGLRKLNRMYYPAELVLRNYIPDSIEAGIFFIVVDQTGTPKQPPQLWQLTIDQLYVDNLEIVGHPVELYVIDPTDHNVLATPKQIGWYDPGEDSDEYHDIELKDINLILANEGMIEIEIDDMGDFYGAVNVILEEEKVIIRAL
jgi:hypothetical protein